uniref:Uncharacterized protein n=1 Tax=Chromera velia CCMP2878 TaxID=1169474 RepID=A0A0G4GD38_9ALVE|eukprot:Cvel_21364.t1-p1 / transcript=Cvel_21364.t1 / gene=Cvel_21364 / organism=Chromera_velia_CCMP2878 / gene_product=hypothetical protein / transcript_product=hypothetical protein / location=Cvel_scaffold1997:8618-13059(-) / protein_length=780 / sequence_SO=supercontig / SO=protein_coding / is_pseudo=false
MFCLIAFAYEHSSRRQDAVAILGDSDEYQWCGGPTLTNRNKVEVNVKHYVARTEVEVLEKVVEQVPHLSSEVSKQLRIFHRHVVDCVSPPDVEWMKRYLQRTDVLRMDKARIMKIRELLSRREKERISGPQLKSLNEQILCLQTLKEPSSLSLSRPVMFSSGGELHGGASTKTKVKTEEETGAIPDTSRQMSVPVSSKQRLASDERDCRSSSSSSSSRGMQVVGVRPDTTLLEMKRKQYEDLVAQISGLNAARGADKLRILEIQKEKNEVLSGMSRRDNFPEGSEGKEAYASELASWAEKKEVFDVGKADRDTLVATPQGYIDQLASDGFVLNEQADKLRKELDVLSPPQAKGVPGGAAEGRLPSVSQMTPLMGGGVYPTVSPPEPAMVFVGGGVCTGDIGAPGAPDIFSFLGVRESSGTQGRPKCDPEDSLIAYTLEEILTSVSRTFVEMRDKVVAMIFAHFFKTIQYLTSALVLEYERIACKPCQFGTYTELLAHHKRLLNHVVEENIVHKLGVKYRLGLLTAHLPNDLIMRWQERQNPVDLTSEVEIIKEIYVIAAQAETFNKFLGDAWDWGLVKGALVEDLKREWEQKAATFGVRDSGGASREGIIPKVPFVAFAGPGGVLQRKSPSKAKGEKPSGGKTPDSSGKGRGNSDRGRQSSAGGGFGKGDGGGSSNRGRSPGSNSSAPSSRYNDKGVEGKDRSPTQAVVNPRGPNRNPVLDRYAWCPTPGRIRVGCVHWDDGGTWRNSHQAQSVGWRVWVSVEQSVLGSCQQEEPSPRVP